MKYSKNQDAAKKFLRWASAKEIYDKWFTSQQGYNCGPTKMWEEHPGASTRSSRRSKCFRLPGAYWAMPENRTRKRPRLQTKYIIVDMYAKAIQGMDAAESVKAAHAELVTIYGG